MTEYSSDSDDVNVTIQEDINAEVASTGDDETSGHSIHKSQSFPSSVSHETANEEDEKRLKPRVPSALTVDNVKKYEMETNPIDVVELMAKSSPDDKEIEHNEADDEANEFDYLPLEEDSPATKTITRGFKFTGEEYVAISIDVQTDESYLWKEAMANADFSDEQPLEIFPSRPALALAAAYVQPVKTTLHSRKHHITSDLSISEVLDTTEEEKMLSRQFHSSGMREDPLPAIVPTLPSPVPPLVSESVNDEDNPVTEINVTESEVDQSQLDGLGSGTSHGIPTVGPPYVLQYKAESKEPVIDYRSIQAVMPEDLNWSDLSSEEQEYYGGLINEMRQQRKLQIEKEMASSKMIDIEPHESFGTQQDRKLAKERAAEKIRAREAEKQKQTVSTNQTNFYAFARQLKTVNYALSSEKCMEEGWTIRPVTPPSPVEPAKEFFVQDSGADIVSGKRYHQTFVEKYYDNGQIFLAVFADGTGTVWYPSGNMAISIVASTKPGRLIFLIHEDKSSDETPKIQAMFEPDGNCTCYYASGAIRTNLTPFGGEYFNQEGERIKKWKWKDTETHVHAPPFQPITFGLSKQVGVRIMAQECIYVTFSAGRRSVRFNAGTRLRLKHALPKINPTDIHSAILREKVAHLQSVIERIHYAFKFPKSPRRDRIKLPNYLSNKLDRTGRQRVSIESRLPPLLVNSKQKTMQPPALHSKPFIKKVQQLQRKRKDTLRSVKEPLANELTVSVTVN
ncbi:unnamed protein product [Clavelina lepadiformis]|uniref:FAM194 C-terminal domain-containing protein n=1 Tax=Clavelina lepadiformis TaxID=159417 RepID=A0ABP0GFZ2_CLALP